MVAQLRNLLILLAVSFSVACGGCDDPDKTDPCADVTCERGVCSAGVCDNPDVCVLQTECLEGFDCNADGVCEAGETCVSDDECSRGVCSDFGVCVNAETCDDSDNCIEGYSCANGTCTEDLCDGVTCERGVCEASTGDCVNSAVCSRDTETDDCLEDFGCYNQECADEATVCADLDCTRGLCSFEDQECVNATTCASDTECVGGFFCNDESTCQQNVCDANMVTCNRGECDPSTGTCVDADPCFAEDECLDGNFCVDNGCLLQADACAACTGNQTCIYSPQGLNVSCDEDPNGCSTALDCNGDRVCNAGTCEAPTACMADDFEPNDDAANAVDWATAQLTNGLIVATLCGGDNDYYLFDTNDDPEFTGTLLVDVNIDPVDVGNGNLTVELYDKNDVMVGTTTTMNDGVAQVAYAVDVVGIGEFTIRVFDAGDVETAGLRYDLFVDLVEATTVNACMNAPELVTTASGNTSAGASTTLGSACVFNGQPAEDIYFFTLIERSFVTVELSNVTFNATVGVRSSCAVDASEVTCADNGGINENETLEVPLDPGTYFLVVQGSGANEAGTYDISINTERIICADSDNACQDVDNAMVCNFKGTAFDIEPCTNGCDNVTGRCIRTPGDVCFTAFDAAAGFSGTVALGTFLNDYDPGDMSCISQGFNSVTEGPDAAFTVTVGPNEALEVNVTSDDFDDVSAYIVSDCGDVATTCLIGNDGFENVDLIYTNNNANSEDLFVIVDSESGLVTDVEVTITVGPVICTPGTQQCNGADLETCNASGTGYNTITCLGGCDVNGPACFPPPNDVCAGAIDATAGGLYSGTNSDYANDYNPAGACGTGAGPEGVWSVNATAGQLLNVQYTTSGYTGTIYVATDCADIGTTCGANDSGFGASQVVYSIPADGTYYIFADTSFSTSTGTFDLDIQLVTPVCTPGMTQCLNATEVDTCRIDGSGYDTTTCATGCDPVGQGCTGNQCTTAYDASAGGLFSGTMADFTNVYNPGSGGCTGFSANGPEAVYVVNGNAGDVVTAVMDPTFDASLYVLTDCGNTNSCLDGSDVGGTAQESIQFVLPASGTAYVIADAFTSSATTTFDLTITIQTPDCFNPGQAVACVAADTLQYCNELGFLTDYACSTTCSGAACDDPRGDLCFDAVTAVDGGSYSGSFNTSTNAVNTGVDGTCVTSTFDAGDGNDTIYAVSLNAGDILDAQLTTSAFGEQMYLLTDCNDPQNTCFYGAINSDRLQYYNTVPGTYFLVVDTDDAFATAAFTLDVAIYPGVCQPGENSCDTNSNLAIECNADGTALTSVSCANGCNGDYCAAPVSTPDTCATAEPISGSVQWLEDYTRFANDYDPGSTSCTGGTTLGNDFVYSVNLSPGEVVDVTVDDLGNFGTPAIYVVTDCLDPATSCVAGDSGAVARTAYAATIAETVNVIIDNSSSSADPGVLVSVDVRPAECTAGQQLCLGNDREYCNEFFELITETCAFGCSAGLCNLPPNDLCAGAIDATAGISASGTIDDYTDDYDASGGLTCTGFGSPGPDGVWFVNALAGQILNVAMDGTFDTSVYVATDCMNVATTCGAGSDVGGFGGEAFLYTIPADGVYYIFADGFSAGASGTFTLDISLATPICTPGDAICGAGADIDVCRVDGSGYDTTTCATGSCDAVENECSGDTCTTAIDATAGGMFTGAYDTSIASDYNVAGAANCTGFSTAGRDVAYQVDLLMGQTLTATLNSPTVDSALYVLTDCADPVNSCVAGDDAFPSGEVISYVAPADETVFVIVDAFDNPGDGTYTLDVTIL